MLVIQLQQSRAVQGRHPDRLLRRKAHLHQMLKFVEIAAVAGERHAGIGAHRQANARLVGRLKSGHVGMDRGFAFSAMCRGIPAATP